MKVSVKLSLLCVAALATSSFASIGWTEATDSAGWSKRCGQGTVVFNHRMWVMGGSDSALSSTTSGRLLNDVWHSIDGVGWSLATDSADWSPRALPTCLAFGGKMWVIGGITVGAESGSATLAHDVWSSTDGATWTRATDSAGWHARLGQAGVVFDSLMWVMGGADTLTDTGPREKQNDVWNSSDGAHWTQVTAAAQWSPRDMHSAVASGGKIWVMGGEVSGGEGNDVWYTTNGTVWSEAPASAGWSGRSFFPVLPFNGMMWVLGGCGSFAPVYGDAWHSTDGAQWTEDTSQAPWHARYGHGVVSFNSQMWVMGGCDSTGVRHDVWYSSPAGVAEDRALSVRISSGLRVSPNPFRGVTELACTQTGTGPTTISIQDVSGRRIRELFGGSPKPGMTNVVWDGRDATGTDAPAGVYFAFVSSGGRTDRTRVIKLR